MEHFVKLLYDRLEKSKDLQMQLFVIMQNAINEMHNHGIIANLTGEVARAVHDPDPEVRVRNKTQVAKAFARQFIPSTIPVQTKEGLSYMANLDYDPNMVNSITLCFQGGIEGLHAAAAANSSMKLGKYIIHVAPCSHDLSALKTNVELLDRMYDDIAVELMHNGEFIYESPRPAQNPAPKPASSQPAPETVAPWQPEKKPGLLARLFRKK